MSESIQKQVYKQTEVGLIPGDWDLFNLSNVLYSISDVDHYMPKTVKNGVPYVMTGDLRDFASKIDFDGCKKITKKDYQKLSKKIKIAEGDIILARYATIGTVSFVNVNIDFIVSYSCVTVKPYSSKLFGLLLNYYFKSNIFKLEVKSNVNANIQENIGIGDLFKLRIPLPRKLTEQRAIATALSDVDALLTSLEQLISKKQAIKQGAMQELLTPPNQGGKRLPGFSGEWEEKTLGDILDVVTDYTANGSFASLKENVRYYSDVDFAVLVRTTDLDKNKFEPERFTDKKGYDFLKKTNLYGGEIIMANVGSIGKVFRVPEYDMPMTLAPNTYLLKFKQTVDEDYMYTWMKTREFYNKLMSKVGSTTLLAVNKDNLRDIEIWMPINAKEQKAIAQVLSDMDEEIKALEEKKEKYQNIKEGMMQELLTGKIRLV